MVHAAIAAPVFAVAVVSCGQQATGSAAGQKQLEFATVSIRQNNAGGSQQPGAPTPDGYHMRNMFMAFPLMTAYVPQTGGAAMYGDDQVLGMPEWMTSDTEHYDIDAKVEESDLKSWQDPAQQPAMMREMLQSMLAERLKLKVHRSTKTGSVYALIVTKSGPKFKETDASDAHAGSYPFPGGGKISMEMKGDQMIMHYFGITMAQLAGMWSGQEGRPVEDRTGLTRKYDVTIQKTAHPVAPGQPNGAGDSPDESILSEAEQLGLNLESAKGEIETLVIDHVERPSEN
ncbi:MAG TPA: TIGR03435 family protein [Terracidiphilus sp.]|jgi:uncharacterized protein (TIGR03435 family)